MKLFQQQRSSATRRDNDMFVGDVFLQDLVTDNDAPSLRVTSVTFEDGARNRWHTHTTEQVLIVTHGSGIVATERKELAIEPGDVVLIDPNELHWHGAKPGSSMTHLAVLLPGKMRTSERQL